MMAVEIPHFALPFQFAPGSSAAVVEQDSIDEIAECVLAILLCPRGYRVELPEFGINDPTFSVPGPDVEAIRTALDLWEPRAATAFEDDPDKLDELVARVQVLVRVRTEE